MRLNPPSYKCFVQCEGFEASYAGGEANIAVSPANYGIDSASCLKHTIEQDFNLVSVSEVESLAGGNATVRMQR